MIVRDYVKSGKDITIVSMDIDGDTVIDSQVYVVFASGSGLIQADFIL